MEAKVVTASAAHWEIVVYWRWEYMGFWSMRFHDLRHTFATHRLYHWMRDGKDLNAMLPYLSAYMGHA